MSKMMFHSSHIWDQLDIEHSSTTYLDSDAMVDQQCYSLVKKSYVPFEFIIFLAAFGYLVFK